MSTGTPDFSHTAARARLPAASCWDFVAPAISTSSAVILAVRSATCETRRIVSPAALSCSSVAGVVGATAAAPGRVENIRPRPFLTTPRSACLKRSRTAKISGLTSVTSDPGPGAGGTDRISAASSASASGPGSGAAPRTWRPRGRVGACISASSSAIASGPSGAGSGGATGAISAASSASASGPSGAGSGGGLARGRGGSGGGGTGGGGRRGIGGWVRPPGMAPTYAPRASARKRHRRPAHEKPTERTSHAAHELVEADRSRPRR